MNQQRIEPGPSQESVWDHPCPPCVEETARHVKVVFNGEVIAETHRARQVLEKSRHCHDCRCQPLYWASPASQVLIHSRQS
jgi:uncharacterized protein (DUF427 family)